MAARPKERRVKAALARRAAAAGVTPIGWVCDHWIARGGRFPELAQSLAMELRESVSRRLASTAAHHLAADADRRIAEARRIGREGARAEARRIVLRPDTIAVDRAQRAIGAALVLGITRRHLSASTQDTSAHVAA